MIFFILKEDSWEEDICCDIVLCGGLVACGTEAGPGRSLAGPFPAEGNSVDLVSVFGGAPPCIYHIQSSLS